MSVIYDSLIRCGTLRATHLELRRISLIFGWFLSTRGARRDREPRATDTCQRPAGRPASVHVHMEILPRNSSLISIHCRRRPANIKNKMFLDPLSFLSSLARHHVRRVDAQGRARAASTHAASDNGVDHPGSWRSSVPRLPYQN